jgi:hypothetical protein
MATPDEMKGAALSLCGEIGEASVAAGDDGWHVVTLPSGRIVKYHAARRVAEAVDVDNREAFGILGAEHGAGYDQASAVARIRARLGTTSDTETIRRCVAVVDYYIGG